jgi:hypothetical protein
MGSPRGLWSCLTPPRSPFGYRCEFRFSTERALWRTARRATPSGTRGLLRPRLTWAARRPRRRDARAAGNEHPPPCSLALDVAAVRHYWEQRVHRRRDQAAWTRMSPIAPSRSWNAGRRGARTTTLGRAVVASSAFATPRSTGTGRCTGDRNQRWHSYDLIAPSRAVARRARAARRARPRPPPASSRAEHTPPVKPGAKSRRRGSL